MQLTKQHVLDFLKTNKLMQVATMGDFPWIATVYYSFDNELNLYFLSSDKTLHVKQIKKNPKVSVAITDSHQDINKPKKVCRFPGWQKKFLG